MYLITEAIPSLISGVSQQPPVLRLPTQLEEQVNAHASEVLGLRKRAPLDYLARLGDAYAEDPFVHAFSDSRGVSYIAVFSSTGVKVYTLDGVEQTVVAAGLDYLALGVGVAAADKLRATTISDVTFVVNQRATVALGSNLTPVRDPEALINIRQGAYGKTYTASIQKDGIGTLFTSTYTVPNGDVATHAAFVGTTYIAQQLYNNFNLVDIAAEGFQLTLVDSTIHIKNVVDDFTVKVDDDFNNNGAQAFKGRVQRFTALPAVAPEGFEIAVVGDDTTAFDNYYVRFVKLNADDNFGVWRECPAQGIKDTINPATMPHVLRAETDGTFTFGPQDYKLRVAGDETTIKPPSFVTRNINDVFIYRNRLGFVAGDSVVLSQASDLYNFWPTTVVLVLDSAPIDLSAADSASDLHAATPFESSLILWGQKKQIALVSDAILTPKSVSLPAVGNFASSPLVRPGVLGNEAFFLKTLGPASRLQALTVAPEGTTFSADDVTVQAPTYLPQNIRVLAVSPNANTAILLSKDDTRNLYVYKTFSEGRQKLQSALYRWEFPATMNLRHAAFERDVFVLLWDDATGAHLGSFELGEGYADPDGVYLTHLDRRLATTGLPAVFSGGNTTFTLPYPATALTTVVSQAADAVPSEVAPPVSFTGLTVTVEGDWTGRTAWVGDNYEMSFTLSPLFTRRALPGGGTAATVTGRTQIRYVTMNHSGTGNFTVEVTNRSRSVNPRTFNALATGRRLGEAVSDSVPISESGSFRFPVLGRNTETRITVKDATHLPAVFQSLEFEALYTERGKQR